jgi:hypothetical protein
MKNDMKIFKEKKLSDIFEEIHTNNLKNRLVVEDFIDDLKSTLKSKKNFFKNNSRRKLIVKNSCPQSLFFYLIKI